jgi:hypothetical protein
VVAPILPDRFRRSGRVAALQGLSLQPWGYSQVWPMDLPAFIASVSVLRRDDQAI